MVGMACAPPLIRNYFVCPKLLLQTNLSSLTPENTPVLEGIHLPAYDKPGRTGFLIMLLYWAPWLSKKERHLALNQDSYFPTLMLEISLMSPKTVRSHKTTAMTTTAFKIALMEPAIGMYELTSQRRTPTTTRTNTTWTKGMIYSFFCLDFRKVRHPFNFGD
jgi:hypothetical protein